MEIAARAAVLLCLTAVGLSGQGYEITRVDANPAKGFHWPYFLTIPRTVKTPTVLLVAPNNTGSPSDDQNVHEQAARNFIPNLASWPEMAALGSPMLVPTFPRPANDICLYTHALDRATLLTKVTGLERIDL